MAEITWCDADEIARGARIYATTKPGCIVWGNGTDQLGNNTFQATRSLLILMALSGNLDVPGGNVFWPAPKLDYPELWDKLPPGQDAKRLGGDRFKALNLTPYAYAHPPSLFRTMLTDEPYPVKTFIVVGNNTVTCFPNSARIIEALKRLDFFVVQDLFMTPTAALADVVLPAAGNLERDEPRLHLHIKGPGGTFMDAVSQKVVEIGERKSDWEFVIELGRKLGLEEYFPSLDVFAENALKPMGVTWDELKSQDYIKVPIEFRKYERMGFGTPTGKFEIYSTIMEEWGYDPLPDHVEPPESPVSTPGALRGIPADPQYRRQAADVLAQPGPPAALAPAPQPRAAGRDQRRDGEGAGDRARRLLLDRDRARAAPHEGQPAPAPTPGWSRCRTAGGCRRRRRPNTACSRCAPTC